MIALATVLTAYAAVVSIATLTDIRRSHDRGKAGRRKAAR